MFRRLALSTLLLVSSLAPGCVAATTSPAGKTVTVRSGDTLYGIARRSGLSVARLRALNSLKGNIIRPGQKLRVSGSPPAVRKAPVKKPVPRKATPRKTPVKKAVPQKAAQKATPRKAAKKPAIKTTVKIPARPPSTPGASRLSLYTVRRGDTLSAIARRAGVSVAALRGANRLSGNLIRPGQRLKVPPRGTVHFAPARSAQVRPVRKVPALPPGTEARTIHRYVRVRPHETLALLARRYRTTPDRLAGLNRLSRRQRTLYLGQRLLVPQRVPVPIPPRPRREAVSLRRARVLNIAVQVLTVDLRHRNVLVTPVLPRAGLGAGAGARVGTLLRVSGAQAVVNGSYFHPRSYSPAGDVVMGGRLLAWGRIPGALAITPDNRATITTSTVPLFGRPLESSWRGMETVVASGPRIVHGGQVSRPFMGIFRDPAVFGRAARSAVGLRSNRDLIFVTTHAKLSTTEMGRVMAGLGAREALLLDGGSSAGLAWNGGAVLESVRSVAYGIGVFTGYTGRRYAR